MGVMGSEPLIQKLFELERAIGKVSNIALRAMIIEAEEAALALDREILQRLGMEASGVSAMTNASLARDLATRGNTGSALGEALGAVDRSIELRRKPA